MADLGLFVGWGAIHPGREEVARKVFAEAMAWYASLQKAGRIESWSVAILEPHGGDLGGFALVRGTGAQLTELRATPEFQRLNTRAQTVVARFGVVTAQLDGAAIQLVQDAAAATADLI